MTASADRLGEFLEVMRQLLEETHETLEAIDTGDGAHLREELGDLLLQVYFHAVIAEESGEFTLDDVAGDIIDKMRRRNPHVFPQPGQERTTAGDAASVNEVWESIKATEKARDSVLDGLPPGLPALLYADKVLDRLERADTADPPEAFGPVRGGDIGDRLLGLVAEARDDASAEATEAKAEAREAGVDPEQALRDAVRRLL